MARKDDGGPAFPEAIAIGPAGDVHPGFGGMSLRDWFAGQALAGILSGPCSRDGVPVKEWFDVPEQAYKLADAMIAERSK